MAVLRSGERSAGLPALAKKTRNLLGGKLTLEHCPSRIALPGGVGFAVRAGLIRSTVHIGDAARGLIEALVGITHVWNPGAAAVRERIDGDGFQIPGGHQVVERLGRLVFVGGIGVDRVAHDMQVFAQNRFPGGVDGRHVRRNGDAGEDTDDQHHHHQLDQGETRRGSEARKPRLRFAPLRVIGRDGIDGNHQVEYLVPFSAVPVDKE